MAGVGLPPCRPMVAEDIRDLQSGTGHARRAYAGGSGLLAVSGVRRSKGLMIARITLVATCV